MAVDEVQFLDSFKGKRIQLTLKSATFLGTVQRINLSKTIVLEDVVDVKTRRTFPGVKLFFGHEILNVEFAKKATKEQGEPSDRENVLEGQLTVAEFQPYKKSIALDEEDGQYVNFVVVDEFQEKFGPAVMHIRKQQVIGIGADGVGAFQHERLCWLQIATKNKVYLFDVLQLGARAFKNGLSMILENQHILKVTHDCRSMAGCLMAQFGVNLTHVFDTQVADVLGFYHETGGFLPDRVGTLQELVSTHLKMPLSQLSSLTIKAQLTKEDRQVWYVRPCPVSLLKVMALSVIHLLPLRLVLLDSLMADYTGLVDAYLSSSRDESVHMQHIGTSSVLELPKELRDLEQMRLERREWATKRYPVTDQGLLKRSDPRVVQPQHPSPSSHPENQDHGPTRDPYPAREPQSPASTLSSLPIPTEDAARSPTLQRCRIGVESVQAPEPNRCRSPEPDPRPPSFVSLVTPAVTAARTPTPAVTALGQAAFSSLLSTSTQPLTSSSSSSTQPLTSSSSSSIQPLTSSSSTQPLTYSSSTQPLTYSSSTQPLTSSSSSSTQPLTSSSSTQPLMSSSSSSTQPLTYSSSTQPLMSSSSFSNQPLTYSCSFSSSTQSLTYSCSFSSSTQPLMSSSSSSTQPLTSSSSSSTQPLTSSSSSSTEPLTSSSSTQPLSPSSSTQPLMSLSSSKTQPLTSSSSSSIEALTPSRAPSVVPLSSSSSAPASPPSYTPVPPRGPPRDLTAQLSTSGPTAPPGGQSLHDALMDVVGRGSSAARRESVSPAPFPTTGRGFILQAAAAALPPRGPSRPGSGPAGGVQPEPSTPAVAAHCPGLRRGQCVPAPSSTRHALTSALNLSFSSFRKT